MKRPPKKINDPIFDRRTILLSILQGVVVLIVVLAVYRLAPMLGESEAQARALAFTTLVIANLSLVFTNRSWSRTIPEMLRTPNSALLWVTVASIFFLGLSLYVPFLASIFKFGQLHVIDLIVCLLASIMSILWFEVLKIFNRRSWKKASHYTTE